MAQDKLTSRATDVFKASREIAKSQALEVRVVGLVQDAGDRLALGTRLAAHTDNGIASVKVLGPGSSADVADADLALIAVRDADALKVADHVGAVAARRRHTLVIALGAHEEERDLIAAKLGVRASQVICSPDSEPLPQQAAARAVKMLGERRYALAAAFPAFREVACAQVISSTAWQNALVATVLAVPGADMLILTGNEIKMILELAAFHGETIGVERAKEILAVVGSGYALRTIARELLDFVPGPGWLVKGGVAYGGTLAIGKAAERYFSLGPEGMAELAQAVRRRLPSKT